MERETKDSKHEMQESTQRKQNEEQRAVMSQWCLIRFVCLCLVLSAGAAAAIR